MKTATAEAKPHRSPRSKRPRNLKQLVILAGFADFTEFSATCGIPRTALGQMNRGMMPKRAKLEQLSQHLGFSIEEVVAAISAAPEYFAPQAS